MKPAPLQAAEGSLWKTMRLVASGQDASTAIAAFLVEYDMMEESWEERADFSQDKEWFQLACV